MHLGCLVYTKFKKFLNLLTAFKNETTQISDSFVFKSKYYTIYDWLQLSVGMDTFLPLHFFLIHPA